MQNPRNIVDLGITNVYPFNALAELAWQVFYDVCVRYGGIYAMGE